MPEIYSSVKSRNFPILKRFLYQQISIVLILVSSALLYIILKIIPLPADTWALGYLNLLSKSGNSVLFILCIWMVSGLLLVRGTGDILKNLSKDGPLNLQNRLSPFGISFTSIVISFVLSSLAFIFYFSLSGGCEPPLVNIEIWVGNSVRIAQPNSIVQVPVNSVVNVVASSEISKDNKGLVCNWSGSGSSMELTDIKGCSTHIRMTEGGTRVLTLRASTYICNNPIRVFPILINAVSEIAQRPTPVKTISPTAMGTPTQVKMTPTRTPSPEPTLTQLDAYLKSLEDGSSDFRLQDKMVVNKTNRVEFAFVPEVKPYSNNVEEAPLEVEAQLKGQTFQIDPITPEKQSVMDFKEINWKWDVMPLKEGYQPIALSLTMQVTYHDRVIIKVFKTEDKTIVVHVPFSDRVADFYKGNWPWLFSVILIPFFTWLVGRWGNKKADNLRQLADLRQVAKKRVVKKRFGDSLRKRK